MKLKKKDRSVGLPFFSEKENKILIAAFMETKCELETEGNATQRLFSLGIYPINSHQTQKVLWMAVTKPRHCYE